MQKERSKNVGHTLHVIVHVMNAKAMKVPDKPKGLLASQCMAKKKTMQQAQAVAFIQLLG